MRRLAAILAAPGSHVESGVLLSCPGTAGTGSRGEPAERYVHFKTPYTSGTTTLELSAISYSLN